MPLRHLQPVSNHVKRTGSEKHKDCQSTTDLGGAGGPSGGGDIWTFKSWPSLCQGCFGGTAVQRPEPVESSLQRGHGAKLRSYDCIPLEWVIHFSMPKTLPRFAYLKPSFSFSTSSGPKNVYFKQGAPRD